MTAAQLRDLFKRLDAAFDMLAAADIKTVDGVAVVALGPKESVVIETTIGAAICLLTERYLDETAAKVAAEVEVAR